ncbi:hypothetical protein [Knoellia subterranea]|nr:hypothetical protein [Knoellia subterranea]
MLLDRRPKSLTWTLPWAYLTTGDDPGRVARRLVQNTGAAPAMPHVLNVENAFEVGDHFLDITYRCSAERTWKPAPTGTSLWWSLDEISSMELATRAKSAMVTAWPQLWPHL